METIPGHLERLPAGGDRLQAELLSREPRERILIAISTLVAERGYHAASIEQIVKRAGVSRATFYEHFENREDSLLACFSEAVEDLRSRAEDAVASAPDWPTAIRNALAVFLDYVQGNPALARTCVVEVVTAGPRALDRYERALQSFAPILHQGRELADHPEDLPETLEDMIIGGLVWMIHQRLLRGDTERFPELLPSMLDFTLTPYLGEARAAELATET